MLIYYILQLLWMLRVTESTLPESGVVEDAFLTHRDVPVNKMGQVAKRRERKFKMSTCSDNV